MLQNDKTDLWLKGVLAHYGVKGMRWGVRRKKPSGPPSAEAAAAEAAKAKIKEGGVQTLSNKELKALNERMNLEQNYSNLTSKSKTKSAGQKYAENLVKQTGQNQVQRVANEGATQLVKKYVGI